jgi:hypothetical protein
MYGGWQLFSLSLLVEVEESLLKMWVALFVRCTLRIIAFNVNSVRPIVVFI